MKTIIIATVAALMCFAPAFAAEPRTYDIGDDLIVCIDEKTPMRIQDGAKMLRKCKDDRSRESLRTALIGAALRAANHFENEQMKSLQAMDNPVKHKNPFGEK